MTPSRIIESFSSYEKKKKIATVVDCFPSQSAVWAFVFTGASFIYLFICLRRSTGLHIALCSLPWRPVFFRASAAILPLVRHISSRLVAGIYLFIFFNFLVVLS